ncbi:PspC domain-containing protein [Anaerofustis stercorihominis]|uniref:PspC domain protein n=2 Tax=Anaerofustis stercorihominis TaxID=214853 RepID=B1C5R0_9FIRM|nr:PspC domain-containing protein [Anaerofustis stercorihominis]EDS73624.1 PspC domain protein [Anaerofustis stercorihominis DSM 17244]MCQ4794712.1 PspC domain-containing protein [Anaerofustis stercorihominis]RGD73862.1 PspC domain-containing protein [Anaerofustis stercorihominis]
MNKKLYKTKDGAMISGVLKGISEYLEVDVTLVRVIYVFLAVVTTGFPFLLLYIILACIMPDKSTLGYDDYEIK